MSEKTAGVTPAQSVSNPPVPQPIAPLVVVQKPQPAPQPSLNACRVAPAVSQEKAVPASHPDIYVVRSGDTLSHIAKAHGTTVKALKAANGLEGDRIVVGARLKIPAA